MRIVELCYDTKIRRGSCVSSHQEDTNMPEHNQRQTPRADLDDSALLKPEEACEWLRVGRSTVFEMIGSGQLRSVKVGRSRRITAGAIRSFVAALEGPQ